VGLILPFHFQQPKIEISVADGEHPARAYDCCRTQFYTMRMIYA
jgi:hypothetical protein